MSLFCAIFAFGKGREVAALGFVSSVRFALLSLHEAKPKLIKGRPKTEANCTNDSCGLERFVFEKRII